LTQPFPGVTNWVLMGKLPSKLFFFYLSIFAFNLAMDNNSVLVN